MALEVYKATFKELTGQDFRRSNEKENIAWELHLSNI